MTANFVDGNRSNLHDIETKSQVSDEALLTIANHTIKPVNSKFVTVFLILNTMIGSGILNQPQVFKDAGIFGALFLYISTSLFIALGLRMLVESGSRYNKSDYSSLANFAFGKIGGEVVDVAIIINCFGALMSYITVVGGTSADLIASWGCQIDFCSVYSFSFFIMCIVVMPLCLSRYFGHLGFISIISIISIDSVLLLVLIGGPMNAVSGPLNMFDIKGTLIKVGSVVFALSCAPATFHAHGSMREKDLKSWTKVTLWSVCLGSMMLVMMGLGGYLAFRQDTSGEILENFTGRYADFFKTMLVLHLCLYIPIDFIVMRHSIVKQLGQQDGMLVNWWSHFTLTSSLLIGTTGLVLVLRFMGYSQGYAFGLILDFTGSIAGSFTSFVMPAAIFIKLSPNTDPLFYPGICMLIFGLFVMITVPVLSILSVFAPELL